MSVFENDMQSCIHISYKKVTKGVITSRKSKRTDNAMSKIKRRQKNNYKSTKHNT